MNWSDEIVRKARDAAYGAAFGGADLQDLDDAAVRAILSTGAEHLAARGGTMTAEEIVKLRGQAEPQLEKHWSAQSPFPASDVLALIDHATAQGARIAALEARDAQDEAEAIRLQRSCMDMGEQIAALEAENLRLKRVVDERKTSAEGLELLLTDVRPYIAGKIRETAAALEQHISDLEKSLENVRMERDEWQRNFQETQALYHGAENRCTTAIRERDQHQQSAETWRKRVEAAAEALADVLPGEVGRIDLLARIAELRRLRDGFGRDLTEHIRTGVEVAEILDGGRGFLGEGIVAGAKRVVSERDEALADNAALYELADKAMLAVLNGGVRPNLLEAVKLLKQPHPSAALLERHEQEVKELRGRLDECHQRLLEEARMAVFGRAAVAALQPVANPEGEEIGACIARLLERMSGLERALEAERNGGTILLKEHEATLERMKRLEERAHEAFRRAPRVLDSRYKAEMAIQIMLNGRWGTCVLCPRDADGFPHPERCSETARRDHNIPDH